MSIPETRYAKSGEMHIAYQVVGEEGPFDLLFVHGWISHMTSSGRPSTGPNWVTADGASSVTSTMRRSGGSSSGSAHGRSTPRARACSRRLTRAIRCASTATEAVGRLGIETRAGLHTGECEVIGDKMSGIAVHTAARVAGQAAANEVLVSSTVKDLVAGSGIRFRDAGSHVLKGVPGEWRLFAVDAHV